MDLRSQQPKRGISLTPMIDVVFLLLVFFMLVSRFEQPVFVELEASNARTTEADAPRLVDIEPNMLRLNGLVVSERDLAMRLAEIVGTQDALIVLRPSENASVQRLLDVAHILKAGGFTRLTVIE